MNDTQKLLYRWYIPSSLCASATVISETSWMAGPPNRILTSGLGIAWLLIFFRIGERKKWSSVGATLLILFSAATALPGVLLSLLFLLLVWTLEPSREAARVRTLGVGLSALAIYSLTLHDGSLMLWDDLYGRHLTSLASGIRPFLAQIAPFLFRRSGMTAEIPTLQATLGPWFLLWTCLATLGLTLRISQRRSKPLEFLMGFLGWGTPVVIALALLSPIPLILGNVLLAAMLVQREEKEGKATEQTLRNSAKYGIAACLLVFILCRASIALGERSSLPRSVAIAKVGLGSMALKRGPFVLPERPFEADFGRLTGFLRSQGVRVVTLPAEWSKKDLEGIDTALFINPKAAPSDRQLRDLYQRVGDGMRLVVAGDHTDIMGVRKPTNRLLSGVPLRLRYDSAIPFQGHQGWRSGFWSAPRFQTKAINGVTPQVSVGASVMAAPTTRPLLIGMYGFSDAGNRMNPPGGLGNMAYDGGEPIFGVPLVVEASYGRGSAVAFGDTSLFQDTAINESSRFLQTSLSRPALSSHLLVLLTWISTFCAALVLFFSIKRPRAFFGYLFGISLILALGHLVTLFGKEDVRLGSEFVYSRDLNPRYPAIQQDEKTDLLTESVIRHGRELLDSNIERALDQKAACLVINSPTRRPSSSQVDDVERFLKGGGNVLVFSGRKSRVVSEPLLARFGISIGATPLGGAATSKVINSDLRKRIESKPLPTQHSGGETLLDACEVKGAGTVLVTTMKKPTALMKTVERGRLIVIGDDSFCTAKSLGIDLKVNLDACRFLYEILGLVKDRVQ